MPLYEYKCRACGTRFEVLQRIGSGSVDVRCPSCSVDEVDKQFSTFASNVGNSPAPCGAPSPAACGTGGFT